MPDEPLMFFDDDFNDSNNFDDDDDSIEITINPDNENPNNSLNDNSIDICDINEPKVKNEVNQNEILEKDIKKNTSDDENATVVDDTEELYDKWHRKNRKIIKRIRITKK